MNTTDIDLLWHSVEDACKNAKLVAWDGCHKIYLAMDDYEAQWFAQNYDNIVYGDTKTLMQTLRGWWDASCGLRFVQAVSHNEADPNSGFVSLIDQFADITEDEDEWDEDEFDEDAAQILHS